jgi:type I restriction enzyme M protein
VLFRGGKEKLIRERLINDDLIEAIISLPPGLFYGTGIPACVLVVNKSKPDALRGKVLFINADREYAEGKAQNKLRPEDIEKIGFVFSNKREIDKYSRLVDRAEIAGQHDYNLNIRRYVDNTPAPEPENVTAHLIGGIPQDEVEARRPRLAQFGLEPAILFRPDRPGYLAFDPAIQNKADIKPRLDNAGPLQATLSAHLQALNDWWQVAQADFVGLSNNGQKLPEVRQELLTTLKQKLMPLGVLDEFLSAGVFVNWWQTIRYDLKTITATGWHHTLIPDEYLLVAFFAAETAEIEAQEAAISQAESDLNEAVESAADSTAYESDEDETISAAVIKSYLKNLLDDLRNAPGDSAQRELDTYQRLHQAIMDVEKRIRASKVTLKKLQTTLELKLALKRVGGDELKAETNELLRQVAAQVAELDPADKNDKRKITALEKDRAALNERLDRIDELLTEIGGQLTEAEAQTLILQKLYDLMERELNRYLNAARRELVAAAESLWDKYAVSSRELEAERAQMLVELDGFLNELGYLR